MLLDSSFLIDLLRGRGRALDKIEEMEERAEPLTVPPGVLFELYAGVETSEERRSVERLSRELERADLSVAAEKEAGRIRRKMEDAGRPVTSIDYLIAGTARTMNSPVLTSDEHFQDITGIEVEGYS